MLISYVRENRTDTSKGIPIGCVVALDADHFGWSLCSVKDTFNKKLGLKIAIGRAEKCSDDINFSRLAYRDQRHTACLDVYQRMKEKAKKYFQKK